MPKLVAAAKPRVGASSQERPRSTQARQPIRNEGEIVDRKPLTPWEQYAQALLFTNEIAYVN